MSITRQEFNAVCPFGSSTTKKHVESGLAIDIAATNQANKVIQKILSDLKLHISQNRRVMGPSSGIESPQELHTSLEDIRQTYDNLVDTNPIPDEGKKQYFVDIFPIPETRCATHKMGLIRGMESVTLGMVLALHDKYFVNTESHTLAAKLTMAELSAQSKGLKRPYIDPQVPTLFSPENAGIIISNEEFELLKLYHDIQESFETQSDIAKANQILTGNPHIMSLVLDIQGEICRFLEEFLEEHPDAVNYSYAFGEFAKIQPGAIPKPWQNSRFLKVVTHNLGPFFEESSQPAEVILKNAMIEARKARIFTQNIFVCEERSEGDFILKGAVTKSCPAKIALAAFFEYFLQEQPADIRGYSSSIKSNDNKAIRNRRITRRYD